ncbi:MAG: DUF1559 domain-containing protein, partial [Pirellulales bacterium]
MSTVRRGVTVVELAVAIAVIGLLCAILLAAIQRSRETARRGQCSNNLRQIGVALSQYQSQYGAFPCGMGRGTTSFLVAILPQIELSSLDATIDYSASAMPGEYGVSQNTLVFLFRCPA